MTVNFFLLIPLVLLSLLLTISTGYLLFLAGAYFLANKQSLGRSEPVNRFAVIVPAYNEELLVGNICQSLLEIAYPLEGYQIHIIADNCSDETVNICRKFPVHVLERHDVNNIGKGYAIDWAINQIDLDLFDAVLIVDADNYVDKKILYELNRHINRGEVAIQCYNAVGNRNDSWFTELLFVSRTIGNELYHEAKYRLGLSSYLMGNGLCFKSSLIKQKGWTAFSAGEDWEYYAQLVEDGINIGFAARAKVFHQESRSLNQATSQRLRWSSGRFHIARTLGIPLLLKGFCKKDWRIVDSSLPLLFPNYSLQINLTLMSLALSLLLQASSTKFIFSNVFLTLMTCQLLLFVTGAIIAKNPLKTAKVVLYAPFFLIWKAVIDLSCLVGLYRGKEWVRTKRHKSTVSVYSKKNDR